MSVSSINSISSTRPVETGTSLALIAAGQLEAGAPRTSVPISGDPAAARAADQAAGEPAVKAGAPVEQKPGAAEDRPLIPMSNANNVSIQFRVDRSTNAITVFIVDRETRRVLRSIPPEELNKLRTGDLLEITA